MVQEFSFIWKKQMRVGRRWRPGIRHWEPDKSADQKRPKAAWWAGRAAVQRPPWSEDHTVAACRRPTRIWAADPWRRWRRWRRRRRCSGSPAQQLHINHNLFRPGVEHEEELPVHVAPAGEHGHAHEEQEHLLELEVLEVEGVKSRQMRIR
jgi:hypothetical protein